MPESERRQVIVAAAFQLIAERGLEGFRVRAVADMAGCNHATLLHYFSSKEALLEAVVDFLLRSLRQEGAQHGETTPLAALRQEYEDLRLRVQSQPEFFVVLNELELRALRDQAVSHMLNSMYDAWRGYLSYLLRQGMRDGTVRKELPLPEVVESLIVSFRGLVLHALSERDTGRFRMAVEAEWAKLAGWITNQS